MPNILVTGATGLVGSHLLEPLSRFYNIHAITRSKINNEILKVKWYHADLKDDFNIKILPANIEAVIYLAQSKDYKDFPKKAIDIFEINTVKLLKMLDYARKAGAKKFIFASSGGVYGTGEHGLTETLTLPANGQNGFYISSKLCSEVLADNYKQFMDVIILRLFFVYGKKQKADMLIPRLFANIKNGVPIKLQGSNGLLLNPIHVSDVVSSVLAVLDLKGSYKINVAGPSVFTLKEICELIGNKVGVNPIFEYDMSSVPRHLVADITNMKKLLINPRVFLNQGLEEMMN